MNITSDITMPSFGNMDIEQLNAAPIHNPEKYIADILEYYRDRDPRFYRFIANRIN